MKLDENERSTQIRLMKVKDMMIEENIKAKQSQVQEIRLMTENTLDRVELDKGLL